MDQPPSLVAFAICSYLSEREISALSRINKLWSGFVCENRYILPKKRISLTVTRKNQSSPQEFERFVGLEKQVFRIPAILRDEVQFLFNVQQKNSPHFYGVVLKQFIPRPHNLYKEADHFDPQALNEMCVDCDYSAEVKHVSEIDPPLHRLFDNLSAKVDFENMVLIDPSTSDLIQYSSSVNGNHTTIRRIHISFSNTEVPNEIVDLFTAMRGCEEVKLVADRSAFLPFDLLTTESLQKAQKIDIHLGHFSAMTRNRSNSSLCSMASEDDHDDPLTRLTAETIKIRGTHLTSRGANQLIKQWVHGERGKFNSTTVLNITIDSSKFKKEEVLRDVHYEERGRLRDSFVVSRQVFGRLEKAYLSWFAGRFSFDANVCDELETQGYRLWF